MKNSHVLYVLGILSLSSTFLRADQISVLGMSSTYAVLAATTVTNTGPTVLNGNLGLYPGTSVTGFSPTGSPLGLVNGTVNIANAAALQAQTDAQAAYNSLLALAPTSDLTGQDLAGLILSPGVYKFSSSAGLNGVLTLDFQGLNDAAIIFQIGSTFITGSGSVVNVINQGTGDNVYYDVGSSATLGTTSVLRGEIIANTSATLTTGATVACGGVIALHGAVTLDTNTINVCSAGDSDVSATVVSAVPEPSSLALMGTGLIGALGMVRRKYFTR